jgi:hypothetical protein
MVGIRTSDTWAVACKEKSVEPCRLCHGPTRRRFGARILEKYATDYAECEACGSLQTGRPTWLAEAYAIPGVHIDVGQAARVIQTWLRLCFFLRNIGFDRAQTCVDYGGSAGLLTRLMRDAGYDYRAFDLYDGSKYANYFRIDSLHGLAPALVSAFEVFEHFPEPAEQLAEILASGPELVVFTTQFYEGQGADWDYLVPCCGQHVFFYTERGLAAFAGGHGFDLLRTPDFFVLARRDGRYAPAIAAMATRVMDAAFVAEHVMAVGWGTEATACDFSYAMERFVRELSVASGHRENRWTRLAARIGRAVRP